jgi:putative integral membrane protein (TIGR02587 family)
MWQLAFSIDRFRLVLLLLLTLPLLVGLSHFVGFERTFGLKDDAVDAFVAYAVGFVGAGAALFLLGVVGPDMAAGEVLGKVSLQAVPASIGALLAQSQLAGGDRGDREGRQPWNGHYARELFLMVVGALFLAMPVAPTEEMILLAYRMAEWRTVALAVASLLVMHAFVYAVEFRGAPEVAPDTRATTLFLRFTVVGYAIALLMSAYVLWTFGRFEGTTLTEGLAAVMVLAFPGAIGAAAARLIL